MEPFSRIAKVLQPLWITERPVDLAAVRALLLSAYAAQSHVSWQRSLLRMFPEWQWQSLTLPARHFSWRVRGNPLYWALSERELLEQPYDVLLATSMVDLATLRGLVPDIAKVPSVLYFHENQFAYPPGQGKHPPLEAQMVSIYSALAADRVLFNSQFNFDSFFTGCQELLHRLPDKVPGGVVSLIKAKSEVLPVPIAPRAAAVTSTSGAAGIWGVGHSSYPDRPLRLVWSGRFEYDKGPATLLHTLHALESLGPDYQLAVIGQQFRKAPREFADIAQAFSHRLCQFGFIESKKAYQRVLAEADIALSTALHEFQGLALLEAVEHGCVPVVPDRLVYRELFGPEFLYQSSPDSPEIEGKAAADLIAHSARQIADQALSSPDVSRFYPSNLASAYRRALQA